MPGASNNITTLLYKSTGYKQWFQQELAFSKDGQFAVLSEWENKFNSLR